MNPINITQSGVLKLLQNIKTNKVCGPDGIHPYILKELAAELAPSLTHIFLVLEIGKIPEEWTVLADICPLYKKNDRSLPVNYRPVSLTCIVCKLLEHIVCSQVIGHLDWTRSMDNGEQVDVFILDFEKAFDNCSTQAF